MADNLRNDPDIWNHVSIIYNGNTLTLAINGRIEEALDIGELSLDFQNPLLIGGDLDDDSDPEDTGGLIDEVRVWNRALTEEEIQANMSRTLTGDQEGLVGYWTFDELDESGRVPDLSGNGNHGTLMGDSQLVESDVPIEVRPPDPPPGPLIGITPEKVPGGKVLSLDGDGDWVEVAASALSSISRDFSVEMWVKYDPDDSRPADYVMNAMKISWKPLIFLH